MSYADMRAELRGIVPKYPIAATAKIINRAWADVRRQNLWSWQLYEGVFISPPLINTGTVTTVQGVNTVTFNTAAKNAINAGVAPYSLIVGRQFRVGISRIYTIWAWDAATGIATLDTVYGEASGTSSYQVYQCYYPAPYQDHWIFQTVRNMQNFIRLNLSKNRVWLDAQDPQRTWYYFPTHVVPYMIDLNPASQTYQFPLFELWGAPQQNFTYQLYGLRKGVDLVAANDTLPLQIGEDCVIARAKYYAYEWAEANKGRLPELQKTDWRFLMGQTNAEYLKLFREYRRTDREYVDNWFSGKDDALYGKYMSFYNSVGATAFPGFN